MLERIHIAVRFTPYQHTSLVNRLNSKLDDASVVVATGADRQYRDGDMPEKQAETMQVGRLQPSHALLALTRSRGRHLSS
ncbi:hypothetical protein JCM17823_04950 [Halorubrum gandharaense]